MWNGTKKFYTRLKKSKFLSTYIKILTHNVRRKNVDNLFLSCLPKNKEKKVFFVVSTLK